jgi:SAM-dependent methyltransferase
MTCRVCGGPLETILDFGEQCLGGQFPKIGEPDPPRFPLVLSRCHLGCGLVQLRDAVDPELMYRNYWYRSGVTQTMREHLEGIAREARTLLGEWPKRVLDIGCNDGTLLNFFSWGPQTYDQNLVGVDPSDVLLPVTHVRIKAFYPTHLLAREKFDLIFTIACFYDTPDPVGFAKAVSDNLAPGGLWCVEVADLRALYNGAWDSVCHEHLSYFSAYTLDYVVRKAGMHTHKVSYNQCNGGSIRLYAGLEPPKVLQPTPYPIPYPLAFPEVVRTCRERLVAYLDECWHKNKIVHLLGASTKMNTVLQYCGIDQDHIMAASDRDPRKIMHMTPGSRIPIVSEESSRAAKPDVYLVGPWAFRDELIQREKAFLDGGGTLTFPLPILEEVKR